MIYLGRCFGLQIDLADILSDHTDGQELQPSNSPDGYDQGCPANACISKKMLYQGIDQHQNTAHEDQKAQETR